jgi:hypothetical protein
MMKWLQGDRPPRTDERVVFMLGAIVVVGSGLLSFTVIVGCFIVITTDLRIDNGLLAVFTGIIGSVLAGAGVSAQQVIASYFSRKSDPAPKLSVPTIGARNASNVDQPLSDPVSASDHEGRAVEHDHVATRRGTDHRGR